MSWIVTALAFLSASTLWQTIADAGMAFVAWLFDQLPDSVVTLWETSFIADFMAFFNGGGTPDGTLQYAFSLVYDLIAWFIPVGTIATQWLVFVGIIATIRLTRWIYDALPNSVTGTT